MTGTNWLEWNVVYVVVFISPWMVKEYTLLEIQPPKGLLSNSCGGLQLSTASKGPFRAKGDFDGWSDGRTNGRTNGGQNWRQTDGQTSLRELDAFLNPFKCSIAKYCLLSTTAKLLLSNCLLLSKLVVCINCQFSHFLEYPSLGHFPWEHDPLCFPFHFFYSPSQTRG